MYPKRLQHGLSLLISQQLSQALSSDLASTSFVRVSLTVPALFSKVLMVPILTLLQLSRKSVQQPVFVALALCVTVLISMRGLDFRERPEQ